ncbi:uncharacterized protein [Henckelia pumila]|uniref:uncharacterized protein n=1 Tax=Henckelia pumila TaxID=405737 RepID=UPI003C6E1675
MRESIQNMNTQVGQLATEINRLEAKNSSSLPSQTVVNPKENVSAISLRSGRDLKIQETVVPSSSKKGVEKEYNLEENEIIQEKAPKGKFPPLSEYKPVPPFPLELKESRKDEGIKELYDTFRRCEGCQRIELGEQVSAVIQKKIPAKCKDPGMLSISCKIGDFQLDTAILDLGE